MSSPPIIRNVDEEEKTTRGNSDCLVEVKAQVMARDDVLGMWGPLEGGGMSFVGLYQMPCSSSDNDVCLMRCIIMGRRMFDNRVILNCVVSPNFQYMKVNPTFHHWAVDGNRFGLTFQTFADASAFEKTITRVVENLKSSGPQLLPSSRINMVSQKNSRKVTDKELCTDGETDKKPCLPEKLRSTSCTSGPLTSTNDRIVSVSSLDNFFGQTGELSDSVLAWRSSSAEICTSSSVGAHGPPTVPYPPQRNHGVSCLQQNAELLVCPKRPARLCDRELPSRVDMLTQTRCKPTRVLEKSVNAPRFPITPKVVVKSGIDKKRAQTPPLPNVPLRTSFLDENLLDLNEKSTYADLAHSNFDTDLGKIYDASNRNRDSSSIYFASSYVHFTKGNVNTYVDKKNEYLYPNFESTSSSSRQSIGVVSSYQDYRNPGKFTTQPPVPLPMKLPHSRYHKITRPKDLGKNCDLIRTDSANFKSKCTYCGEYYLPKSNRRGVCADGPDRFRDCLRACNCCAQAALYHCADEEDGNDTDLWTCGACDKRSCRQWTVLTLVCLLLPCMWCFLPLRTCHRCGVAFGCCGARHQPTGPIL